jgi:REP element-mobilizing transposase RayT
MNQKPPRRKPSRLGGYDYSQPGGYFVTLVTHQRTCVFGDIIDGEMRLNTVGKIVQEEWIRSAQIRSEVMLDEFIIMPNHFHAILFILDKNNRKHNFLEFQPQVRATLGRPNQVQKGREDLLHDHWGRSSPDSNPRLQNGSIG